MKKKKKVVIVVSVVTELLLFCIFMCRLSVVNPQFFLCGMFFFAVTAVIMIPAMVLVAISFIDGEGREAKACSIGMLSFGTVLQLGLFGLFKIIVPSCIFHYAIIAISSFGAGQYVYTLFRSTAN